MQALVDKVVDIRQLLARQQDVGATAEPRVVLGKVYDFVKDRKETYKWLRAERVLPLHLLF